MQPSVYPDVSVPVEEAEEWRPIPGWEGLYEVSSYGRVRSHGRVVKRGRGEWLKPGRILRGAIDRYGRPIVGLSRDGVSSTQVVHQLVLIAFHGPRPPGMFGCHNDGNPANNHVSNLRWDTPASNTADMFRHGTATVGERAASAKLCNADVSRIRTLLAEGWTPIEIASEYKVHRRTISDIARGKTWRHLA